MENLEDPLSHLVSGAELWPLLCPSRFPEQTMQGSQNEQDKTPGPPPGTRGQGAGAELAGETVPRTEQRPCGPWPPPQPKAGRAQGRGSHHPCSLSQQVTLSWRSPVSSLTPSHWGSSGCPQPQLPGLLQSPPDPGPAAPPGLLGPPPTPSSALSFLCVLKTPLTLRSVRITQHLHSMLSFIP